MEMVHSKRRLAVDTAITQTGRVLQITFSIVTFVILARRLGVREFGVFSTIVAVQTACFALADLGLGQLALRAVAQQHADETIAIRKSVPWLYLSSSIVLAVSCLITLPLVGGALDKLVASILIGMSYIYTSARIGLERGYWLGSLQFGRATLVDVCAAGLRALGIGLVGIAGGATLLSFAGGMAVSGILTVWVIHTWLSYPASGPPGVRLTHPWRLFREAAPFALSSLTWNTFTELPKILLAPVAGAAAVGLFAAGARVLSTALVPLQSLLLVITPRLFAFASERRTAVGQAGSAKHPYLKAVGLGTLAASILTILVVALAPALPLILGPQYRPAIPILRILALSLPFLALASVSGDWLGGVSRQRLRFLLTLLTAVLAIPGLWLASRADGAAGAAIAYVLLTAWLATTTVVASRRYLHS
jgi:O-antigen/teichoic acid export membrane protein